MNVLIILGHPNTNSFNHAIADICRKQIESNGHTVYFHDLYAEKFNPILFPNDIDTNANSEIDTHCSHLKNCDGIIVIHPNWWGQPPAIIKGWMDRVLLPGVAYEFKLNNKGDSVPVGLLKAKVGIVINTSNSATTSENDILDSIWKYNVFNVCGINEVKRINLGMVNKSDDLQRANWLLEIKDLVSSNFPTLK